MTKIEIILATLSNLRGVFVLAGVLFAIGSSCLGIICFMDLADGDGKLTKKMIPLYCSKVLPCFLIVVVLCALPTVDDLWKVRIGLIKLQLASPENIQKGSEEIIRIGKQLECKYVGCDEEKEKNGKSEKN